MHMPVNFKLRARERERESAPAVMRFQQRNWNGGKDGIYYRFHIL